MTHLIRTNNRNKQKII